MRKCGRVGIVIGSGNLLWTVLRLHGDIENGDVLLYDGLGRSALPDGGPWRCRTRGVCCQAVEMFVISMVLRGQFHVGKYVM